MRFLLGVLVGYTLRGKQKLLIRFLVTLALVVYWLRTLPPPIRQERSIESLLDVMDGCN